MTYPPYLYSREKDCAVCNKIFLTYREVMCEECVAKIEEKKFKNSWDRDKYLKSINDRYNFMHRKKELRFSSTPPLVDN